VFKVVFRALISILLCGWISGAASTGAFAAEGDSSSYPIAPFTRPADVTNRVRIFRGEGVIRELPPSGDTVIVRHEAIEGFMPKMTMEFNVRDTNQLKGLRAGDLITFRVNANASESWVDEIRRTGTNAGPAGSIAQPMPSIFSASQLKHGDMLTDAELTTEEGRTVKWSDFKGRAVGFTFLFTRCPLPDYCPRMNQNFGRARELLQQLEAGPTNWQFISISFDTEFDRPEVLKRYAQAYRGSSPDRWLFAVASTNVMAGLASQLEFRFANEGGTFVHNLRTIVLDPQGRIYRQFQGNGWKPEQLAEAMAEAAQSKE